jgi:hypothetical protein
MNDGPVSFPTSRTTVDPPSSSSSSTTAPTQPILSLKRTIVTLFVLEIGLLFFESSKLSPYLYGCCM